MQIVKSYQEWRLLLEEEESAARMPVDEKYWLAKGKSGKNVALYTHDDMDGIYSAIEMKNWLLNKGFNIVKYGILNYSDGWKYTTLDPKLINVVLDFANMPGDERDELVDYYLDHHGDFTPEQKEKYKNSPVKKLHTASAYEAVLIALGLPQDQLKTEAIDMIDAAKYDQYKVSWQRLLNFDIPDMINFAKKSISRKADLENLLKRSSENTIQLGSQGELVNLLQDFFGIETNGVFDEETEKAVKKFQLENSLKTDKDPKFGVVDFQTWSSISRKFSFKGRLEFAAAFNQFLKRSDTKTIISVIQNCKDVSIYSIYNVMSQVSPYHNIPKRGPQKGLISDFKTDAQERLDKMQRMTRGKSGVKKVYQTMSDFLADYQSGSKIDLSGQGYQIIGNLAFVPTGTWANALRARTIIEKDCADGKIMRYNPDTEREEKFEPDFILLQYGGTLQVCSYKPISKIKKLPMLKKKGSIVNDLGVYMTGLLEDFRNYFGYYDPDTASGQDEITVSGGHGGIGSISNIFGECGATPQALKNGCVGNRFIDMFKNKIISDLSGVSFSIKTKWGEKTESKMKEPEMDSKVISAQNITKLDKYGRVIPPDNL
jgi:hypothetical protein